MGCWYGQSKADAPTEPWQCGSIHTLLTLTQVPICFCSGSTGRPVVPQFTGSYPASQLAVMREALARAVEQLGVKIDEDAAADMARAVMDAVDAGEIQQSALVTVAIDAFRGARGLDG